MGIETIFQRGDPAKAGPENWSVVPALASPFQAENGEFVELKHTAPLELKCPLLPRQGDLFIIHDAHGICDNFPVTVLLNGSKLNTTTVTSFQIDTKYAYVRMLYVSNDVGWVAETRVSSPQSAADPVATSYDFRVSLRDSIGVFPTAPTPMHNIFFQDFIDAPGGVPSIMTMNRDSLATYIGADGVMRYADRNTLRHEYDSLTGEYKGVIIEGERYNYVLWADDLSKTQWVKTGITYTMQDSVYRRAGGDKAFVVTETTDNSAHSISQACVMERQALSGEWLSASFSVDVSKSSRMKQYMKLADIDGTLAEMFFDVSTQTIFSTSTNAYGKIEDFGNGVLRIYLSVNLSRNTNANNTITFTTGMCDNSYNVSYVGSVSGYFVCGAHQLEQNYKPSSFIPTTDEMGYRAADNLIFNIGTDVDRVGGFYVDYFRGTEPAYQNGSHAVLSLEDTTDALILNRVSYTAPKKDNYKISVVSNGVVTNELPFDRVSNFACRFSSNGVYGTVDGLPPTGIIHAQNLDPFSKLTLNRGYYRHIAFWSRNLIDLDLVEMTKTLTPVPTVVDLGQATDTQYGSVRFGTDAEVLNLSDGVVATPKDVQAIVTAMGATIPIGMEATFPVNNIPTGWLVEDGSIISKAMYPDLVLFLTGDPNALTATLPDMRGEFARGADLGRGVDLGRQPNTAQKGTITIGDWTKTGAQLLNIYNNTDDSVDTFAGKIGADVSDAVTRQEYPSDLQFTYVAGTATAYGSTTNVMVSRPRNVAKVWCIRAFNAPLNLPQSDLVAIAEALNNQALVFNPNVGKYSKLVFYNTASVNVALSNGVRTTLYSSTVIQEGEMWQDPANPTLCRWKIPEDGVYELCANITTNSTYTSTINIQIDKIVDGNRSRLNGMSCLPALAAFRTGYLGNIIPATKGSFIEVSLTAGGTSGGFYADSVWTFATLKRIR